MAEVELISECCLEMDGRRLRYLHGGHGPPVVLIHGFLGGSHCWRFTLPFLARRYRVYAIDLPGLGASEAQRDADCGIAAQAGCVLRFIEKMGLCRVDVVGCSFGGAVALHAALQEKDRKPARLRSLVLAAPVNPWSQFGRGRLKMLATSSSARALLRLVLPYSRPLHSWALRRLYADPARIQPGTLEGYSPVILEPGRALHVLSAIRSWRKDLESLRAGIKEVDVPVLLIWGDRDRAVDPASCAALKEHLANCEAVRLPDVGHMPFEEAPEEFNRLVMEFLGKQA
jgi:pimeloyl-ACP methyl ester carboxylesterase